MREFSFGENNTPKLILGKKMPLQSPLQELEGGGAERPELLVYDTICIPCPLYWLLPTFTSYIQPM